MTEEQIENYIKEDLGHEPRHDCRALSYAINDVAEELQHDSYDLMKLLLAITIGILILSCSGGGGEGSSQPANTSNDATNTTFEEVTFGQATFE